jgi:hypothetical protein
MISSILSFATAVTLGLLAGSLLLEGAVLVPFWQKLTPKEFFVLHPAFGRRLFYYFAPLTLLAALVPALSALWLMGLSFFPLYFRKANEAFSNRIVSDEELTGRLSEWAKVHAIRTVIAIVSFGAAVIAIARP